jgi:protein subunit release factor A
MKLVLEIRAAEGGDDAKLLVGEQSSIYLNYAKRAGLLISAMESGKG